MCAAAVSGLTKKKARLQLVFRRSAANAWRIRLQLLEFLIRRRFASFASLFRRRGEGQTLPSVESQRCDVATAHQE
jgi:hypothetical protein